MTLAVVSMIAAAGRRGGGGVGLGKRSYKQHLDHHSAGTCTTCRYSQAAGGQERWRLEGSVSLENKDGDLKLSEQRVC